LNLVGSFRKHALSTLWFRSAQVGAVPRACAWPKPATITTHHANLAPAMWPNPPASEGPILMPEIVPGPQSPQVGKFILLILHGVQVKFIQAAIKPRMF